MEHINKLNNIFSEEKPADVAALQESFNNLPFDKYMNSAHSGTRQRRFGRFNYDPRTHRFIQLGNVPYEPRYNNHNQYQNGAPRLFDPITEATATNPALAAAIRAMVEKLPAWFKVSNLEIKMQQIRIVAAAGTGSAEPTPEGIHRDGETFIGVIVMNRINVKGGEVTVYNQDGTETLTSFVSPPLEGYMIDDREVMHSVTAITAIDPTQACSRDVFIFNFNPMLPEESHLPEESGVGRGGEVMKELMVEMVQGGEGWGHAAVAVVTLNLQMNGAEWCNGLEND